MSYDVAYYKFVHHPDELKLEDIYELKARDPWLAKQAAAAAKKAMHDKMPKAREIRVVRLKRP